MMTDTSVLAAMAADACRLAMAVIFAEAAWHALRDWPAYAAVVQNYRVAPAAAARLAALIVPPAQLAAAVLLLAPVPTVAGPVLGLALMCVFTGAMAINLARGRTGIDCGCGGATGQHLSTSLLVRNAALCGLLAIACAGPAALPADAAFAVGVTGSAAFMAILYFAASQMLANAQVAAA